MFLTGCERLTGPGITVVDHPLVVD